jgi:hypothetical protein
LVVAFLLMGVASYAIADSTTIGGTGAPKTSSGTVTVAASVNAKLTLTVTTPVDGQAVDFGSVAPGSASGPQTVMVTVQSNRACSISKTLSGAEPIGLNTSLPDSSTDASTAGKTFSDDYSLSVPWTTDPGAYTATVQYTVMQD